MKKIVVMPVKNEGWILEKTLACHSLWADHIIIADQNSTDASREIYKKFPKVIFFDNPDKDFNEGRRRQLLLDKAREFSGENLIFALDADEILSAGILDGQVLDRLEAAVSPGMSARLEWVNLWKSPGVFRDDASVWSKSYKPFVYRDDREMSFVSGGIHLSRVPEAAAARAIEFPEVKVLHFQFVDFPRMLAKQRFYRVLEKVIFPRKNSLVINYRYRASKNEKGIKLAEVPNAWMRPYAERGINLSDFPATNFYWQDAEVLKYFAVYGTKRFAWLDIWDVDWEQKRQQALALGLAGMPDFTIK